MIKLITGERGSGKTKIFVENINEVIKASNGDVIVLEKGAKLTYEINYKARLVSADRFGIDDYHSFYGFVAGLLASNYDITDIFVDGILRMCGRDYDALGEVLAKIDKLTDGTSTVVITVSANDSDLPESILKYK